MAKLMRFDDTEETVVPADPQTGFSLGELYTLIGCQMVEAVYLDDGNIMVIDEEGKLRDDFLTRKNRMATLLLSESGGIAGDFITGNALLCSPEEFQ